MPIENIFPTPLGTYKIEDGEQMALDLTERIYQVEKELSGNHDPYSLKGKTAFHTPANLVFGDDPVSCALRHVIFNATRLYWSDQDLISPGMPPFPPDIHGLKKFDCWGVILRKGDYSTTHSHPECKFSGVMYVQLPPNMAEDEGNLVFIDPKTGARSSGAYGSMIYQARPKVGTIYMFPNWLEHYVESHSCDGDRISISWNIDY